MKVTKNKISESGSNERHLSKVREVRGEGVHMYNSYKMEFFYGDL